MKKAFVLMAIWISLQGLTACRTTQEKSELTYYDGYNQTVEMLKASVDRGELTVSEAEKLRQEAFKKYTDEMKEKQIAMEYRNY